MKTAANRKPSTLDAETRLKRFIDKFEPAPQGFDPGGA
jgi:hypothetical protein